ncbi:hypothetical protein ACFVT5_28540 [Streptomyces sp. NPDC058001]|uniref:hypothetical protein n=1 Tax=Streptomyces sp. NPDC058001 TaxID=3346300 RepID=UPI0036E76DDD
MQQINQGLLVLDATLLNHSARADNIDLLGDYLKSFECWTTEIVLDELKVGYSQHATLRRAVDADWLKMDPLDSLDAITTYAEWSRKVGVSEMRHRGEASIFACAQLRQGIAITDDRQAALVAVANGIEAHGSLWLLARLVRERIITVAAAESFIEALLQQEARLPCSGRDFVPWCAAHGVSLD